MDEMVTGAQMSSSSHRRPSVHERPSTIDSYNQLICMYHRPMDILFHQRSNDLAAVPVQQKSI